MSSHGNHWSLPVLTSVGHGGRPPRPQSRSAGVVDGSLFTRVGPVQVVPPLVDLKSETSVFVLTLVPFRLSAMTR